MHALLSDRMTNALIFSFHYESQRCYGSYCNTASNMAAKGISRKPDMNQIRLKRPGKWVKSGGTALKREISKATFFLGVSVSLSLAPTCSHAVTPLLCLSFYHSVPYPLSLSLFLSLFLSFSFIPSHSLSFCFSP